MPTAELTKEIVKQYLETFLHDKVAPLAKLAVKQFPDLKIDSLAENVMVFLVPAIEGALRTKFGKEIEKNGLLEYAFETATDLVREFIQELRRLGESPAQAVSSIIPGIEPGTAESLFPERMVLFDPRTAGRYHHLNCMAVPRTHVVGHKPATKDKPEVQGKAEPRSDLQVLTLAHAAASSFGKASCCAGMFAVDEAAIWQRVKLVALPPPPKPAQPASAGSLTGWIGLIAQGRVPGTKPDDAGRLTEFVAQVKEPAVSAFLMSEVNAPEEIVGLLTAKDQATFEVLAGFLKDRKEASAFAGVLGIPLSLASGAGSHLSAIDKWLTAHGEATSAKVAAFNARLRQELGQRPPQRLKRGFWSFIPRLYRLALGGDW